MLSAYLAASGPGELTLRNKMHFIHLIPCQPQLGAHCQPDVIPLLRTVTVLAPGFDEENDLFCQGRLVVQAEGGDTMHPLDQSGKLLKPFRRVISSPFNDDIFPSTGHEKLSISQIAQVSCIKPGFL